METTGDRIDKIRVQKGLSYADLADMLDNVISLDGIRKAILNDRVKDAYVEIFSKKLDVNLNWLRTGATENELNEPNVKYGSPKEEIKSLRKQLELMTDERDFWKQRNQKISDILRDAGFKV